MLVLLLVALVLLLAWIGWSGRKRPRAAKATNCCGTGPWPPTDLVDDEQREPRA